ncbi:hypothetical protein, partial [Escherichia coli]|uniref:hypothetical protein n=1 Tax=Escherichia coli TaxID=562 RepID=UPI0013816AAE
WAILLRQKQKKLIMLPSETMIWQPEFTDKTLSRKPGAVHCIHSAPGSFRSIPATFVAPCSSLTTFPLALRPIVHPELLLPAHTTPM